MGFGEQLGPSTFPTSATPRDDRRVSVAGSCTDCVDGSGRCRALNAGGVGWDLGRVGTTVLLTRGFDWLSRCSVDGEVSFG